MEIVPESFDETLEIDTPENVVFGYEVAGIGSRFLAALIDSALIGVIQLVIFLFSVVLVGSFFRGRLETFSGWILAAIGLISFVILWGYYIFFEVLWNGQSPGKRVVKLRVLQKDGAPVTLSEAIIRNLVRVIDFLPLFYGLGVVVMFVNDQSKRLGDLVAGTLVVHDRLSLTLTSLEEDMKADALPEGQARALVYPIERLSPDDLRMAQDFLRRRAELVNRDTLALRIASALCKRMDIAANFVNPVEAEKLILDILGEKKYAQTRSRE